jgi:hypothetical protein
MEHRSALPLLSDNPSKCLSLSVDIGVLRYVGHVLFGRAVELETGQRAFAQAAGGRGTVLVLSGEPGIGKSTLARAIADAAAQGGARVTFGRAWEVGGAPPYWPWTQALAELDLDLAALLGTATNEVGGARRVVAFDRVTRALTALAKETPLVVVLDDVHAADAASLELAVAFARGIARHRVLLLATTRESELTDAPRHDELVSKLAREGQRLPLRRLPGPAIAEWLATAGFQGDVAEVVRVTEGHPLFVEEAVRAGADRLGSGDVAVMIRQHLERASDATRAALAVASVLGREVPREDVVKLAGNVDAAETEALRLGILSPSRDTWLFSHVLLRDALYDGLPPSRRAQLHALAARLHGDPSHLLAGASVLPRGEVVEGVAQAARKAIAQHAIDDATALVERARERLPDRDEHEELTLDLVLCEARMTASPIEGRALAATCAERAKRLDRPVDVARAALTYAAELMSGRIDPTMVRLLEEALACVPEREERIRARLLTRLAAALIPPTSDEVFQHAARLAAEGSALARASGDPDTLLYALRYAANTLGYAVDVEVRYTMIRELMALARARGDMLAEASVGAFHAVQLFEMGQPARGRAEAARYCQLIEGLPVPHLQWRSHALKASLAALEGRFDEAYAFGEEVRRTATDGGARHGLAAWSLMHIAIAVCSGNTAELARHDAAIRVELPQGRAFGPSLACLHALLGRFDEARDTLRALIETPHGAGGSPWAHALPWHVSSAQAVVILQDRALAERFYPHLQAQRLRGRFFWGPSGVFPLGPTARMSGEVALLLGRKDEARAHLDEAIADCRAAEATSLLRLCESARARVDGDAAPVTPRKAAPMEVSLVRDGDVWVVTSRRSAVRVKHAKGFEYLAALLESPGREHYVLTLGGAGEAPEDAGALLDPRAKASYRERVEDLEDRLAEAERHGDAARAESARQELGAIADELAGAVGLGGRDRKAASNVERARVNVQRRLKDAIRRIAEHDPDLGRYLDATIRTGTYCSYQPLS